MAVYICNICGERHECNDRPGECAVCGGQDFRLEGESVPQAEVRRNSDAGDIDHLFTRHNMVFPPVKAEQDRKEKQKYETDAREKAREDSEVMAKSCYHSPKDKASAAILFFCVLGWAASFASCFFMATGWPWLISTVIIGIIFICNNKSYKNYVDQTKENSQKVLTDCEDEIIRYGNDQARNYKAYCDEFERTSQKLSEEYVGTEFVIHIAEWIFEPFDRKIKTTDREERIAAIKVEHSYSVYADRIVCSNGTYDFRGHGLRDVDDPVCQTALSIAIAAAVKILIMQNYPQDPSGTPITVSTEISYHKDYPTETITYTAKNGNHNAASVW